MTQEGIPKFEAQPKKLEWRKYFLNPENLPPSVAEKFDLLSEMANDGSEESKTFLKEVESGGYKDVPRGLVQYFKDSLTPEEVSEMLGSVKQGNPHLGF